jgi:hypothetical protein
MNFSRRLEIQAEYERSMVSLQSVVDAIYKRG